jgi:glycosyltransferase involved in cell wall biosynthesis
VTFFLLTEKMAHRHYVFAQGESGLPVVPLKGRSWQRSQNDNLHWNQISQVLKGRFDVLILGGWAEPTYLHLWCRHLLRPTRILFWVESTLYEGPRKGPKEVLKRWMLRWAAGCVVPGQRAAEYCHHLGMPKGQIFVAPNAADGEFFHHLAALHGPQRHALRRAMGLSNPTFLFVGRLVDSFKDIRTLLHAIRRADTEGPAITLLLVGDGPDRQEYEILAARLGCRDVRFLGLLDHTEISRYYAAVDALVLPSRSETWGFVLNEAMEFALPLVVSEAVGASPDLVRNGENGFVVPVGKVDPLARALVSLAQDEMLRQTMGKLSKKLITKFSPEAWADGMLRAIHSVLA